MIQKLRMKLPAIRRLQNEGRERRRLLSTFSCFLDHRIHHLHGIVFSMHTRPLVCCRHTCHALGRGLGHDPCHHHILCLGRVLDCCQSCFVGLGYHTLVVHRSFHRDSRLCHHSHYGHDRHGQVSQVHWIGRHTHHAHHQVR